MLKELRYADKKLLELQEEIGELTTLLRYVLNENCSIADVAVVKTEEKPEKIEKKNYNSINKRKKSKKSKEKK